MSRPQGETRLLTVVLTAEELEDRGADLAAAVRDADDQERRLEGRKAAWREELKSLKEDLATFRHAASKLAEIVRTGKDKRDVACSWLYALAEGWAFLVRDDTNPRERIQSRKLKDEERQLTLGEAPFAEPTPEELAEWLAALPVNEESELPAGHAETVTAEDQAADLQDDSELGMGQRHWNGEDEEEDDAGDDQGEFEEDYDEGGEDTPIEEDDDEDEEDAAIDDVIEAGEIVVPPLNPNLGLSELLAMPEEEAEKLVKRSRAKR